MVRVAERAARRVFNSQVEHKYDGDTLTPASKPSQLGAYEQLVFADFQGDGDHGQRIGDQITLTGMHVNTRVRYQTTGTFIPTNNYQYQRVRQIIFEYNKAGVTPGYTNLFNNANYADVMIQHFNHDSLKDGKLRILDDRVVTVWDPALGNNQAEVRLSVKIPNSKLRKEQRFESAGGSTTLQHPMWIAWFTEWDTTTYTDFYPDIRMQSRFDYTDA